MSDTKPSGYKNVHAFEVSWSWWEENPNRTRQSEQRIVIATDRASALAAVEDDIILAANVSVDRFATEVLAPMVGIDACINP